ncbi:aldehyde dehydrogenase family protein [Halobellus captivus]|uniref:aldehyde dehydrogenase family protein n=1 Tax=Halobellus captivus TaxID=2592614 RepID=UPI0011A53005|nr:aldehyde dehydrogenase family protein [Halobellus captivus]
MSQERVEQRGMFINGTYRQTDETFDVEDPSTGDVIASVTAAGSSGVDAALESAERAQAEWAAMDPVERGRVLREVARGLEAHVDEVGELASREIGRPLGQSKHLVANAVDYLDYYAGMTDKIEGESFPLKPSNQAFSRKEPIGVSAQIVPWNAPVLLCFRGVAPALAAGNAVVVKPSPFAPGVILKLAEIASEAGLPDGLFNVVPGLVETSKSLTTDSRVDQITFTGSVSTGQIVGKTAIDRVIPTVLELGGKSPGVVFDDADLDAAVDGAMKAITLINGQVCFATTRIFVHEDVYDEFKQRYVDAVESITLGPGVENPDLGPVISADAVEQIDSYVQSAVQSGATALTGGQAVDREGNFYEPTVIEGAADDAEISCEEVFGPVINLYSFSDEEEVIRRANDTEFGLYATVWTNTLDRAHRVANGIEAGSVMVNQYAGSRPQTPFGGYKKSGLGREKGMQAVDHYTQLKTVNVNIAGDE